VTASVPPIVKAGFPVLRSRAAEVAPTAIPTPRFQQLVASMVEAMRAAPGVGLAAPQLGVGERVIVLEDREALMGRLVEEERRVRERVPFALRTIVNPVVEPVGSARVTFFEGCLSVPGYMALVERHLEVSVSGLDEHGAPVSWQVRGWPARILQHEVDHLDGMLYVDRMLTRSFFANEEVLARWLGRSIEEIRKELGI
jgi:peptide deformylase